MKLQSFGSLIVVAVLAAASTSCGEFVRNQGRSPAQLVITSLQGARGNTPTQFGTPLVSDVETLVTTPDPCTQASPCHTVFGDLGQVTMSLILKDPGAAGTSATPTSLNVGALAIAGPLFGLILLAYAFGVWRLRAWVIPLSVIYAFYVPVNMVMFWSLHQLPSPGVRFIVMYLAIALTGSVGTALYIAYHQEKFRD